MSIHIKQLLHCRFPFAQQLWIIVLFADFLFLAVSLPGVIDLLDVSPGLQHHLQSAVIGRASAVIGHQAPECSFGSFILKKLTTFISEGDKKKYQKIIVCFCLVFSLWIKESAVRKSRLCKLPVLPVSIAICTAVIIVGYEVVETNAF